LTLLTEISGITLPYGAIPTYRIPMEIKQLIISERDHKNLRFDASMPDLYIFSRVRISVYREIPYQKGIDRLKEK
jgi:hypothetical protein